MLEWRLSKQFQIDEISSVEGFCIFLDTKNNCKILDFKPF